jgi:hypothetical protein
VEPEEAAVAPQWNGKYLSHNKECLCNNGGTVGTFLSSAMFSAQSMSRLYNGSKPIFIHG